MLMMATTSGEKVKYRHCEEVLKKKKLKEYTKKVHGKSVKAKLVSISNADI